MSLSADAAPLIDSDGVETSVNDNGEDNVDGRDISTNSSSSGHASATGVVVTKANCLYKYPYDYFIVKDGNVPTEEAALRQRWEHRKKRQEAGAGLIDVVGFDMTEMIEEMKDLRKDLRKYTHLKYMEHIHPLLYKHGVVKECGQRCVLMEDVCEVVRKGNFVTMEKSDILFEIFHYKAQNWTSNTVDAWAQSNGIWIEIPEKVSEKIRQRNNNYYRGSFGPIVQSARMESLKKIMRNMWSGKGWKIAAAKNQKDESKAVYTERTWGIIPAKNTTLSQKV